MTVPVSLLTTRAVRLPPDGCFDTIHLSLAKELAMFLRNVVRFVGFLMAVALVVAIPSYGLSIVSAWFWENIIVMAVLLAIDVVGGAYLMYLIIRYVIVQYWGKILG